MIYAVNSEWLSTLTVPPDGLVWIMSEDGVFSSACVIGSLRDGKGEPIEVPEGLLELQQKHCQK